MQQMSPGLDETNEDQRSSNKKRGEAKSSTSAQHPGSHCPKEGAWMYYLQNNGFKELGSESQSASKKTIC
jgi:hypothetical protein